MGKRRSNKTGRFIFYLHSNKAVGPNRTTYDPLKALRFFNSISTKAGFKETIVARVVHIETGLKFETETAEELTEFVTRVVKNLDQRQRSY